VGFLGRCVLGIRRHDCIVVVVVVVVVLVVVVQRHALSPIWKAQPDSVCPCVVQRNSVAAVHTNPAVLTIDTNRLKKVC
jgi:hypothetical protein